MGKYHKRVGFLFIACLCTLVLIYQNCAPTKFTNIEKSLLSSTSFQCQNSSAPELIPVEKSRWGYEGQLASAGPAQNSLDSDVRWMQVMSAPVVGDLDGDGVPEMVFVSYGTLDPATYSGIGRLHILDGKSGKEKLLIKETGVVITADGSSTGVTVPPSAGSSTPLIIKINSNSSSAQIIYLSGDHSKIVALNYVGGANPSVNLRWSLPVINMGDCYGGLAAGDIDSSGSAAIIAENLVIRESGGVPVATTLAGNNSSRCTSFALSVATAGTGPGSIKHSKMDVVTSNGVFNSVGQAVWRFPSNSNYVYIAAANILGTTDEIQIATVSGGNLEIFKGSDGTKIWSTPIGIGSGGPPNIGDFDGDGHPDIAVAGNNGYVVVKSNGQILWQSQTQDKSSGITGSSLFDFNGDGVAEIIYGDEGFFRIYHGAPQANPNDQVIWSTKNPNHTLLEYPLVADLAGDGTSQLIIVTNNAVDAYDDPRGGHPTDLSVNAVGAGVRIFKASSPSGWVPTRPLWNQYSYFVNNVTDDLRATDQTPLTQDFFRQNVLNRFRSICK